MSDSARLPCPRDSPGKNTGVGCHALLQGISPTQGSNPHLLYLVIGRRVLYHRRHLARPEGETDIQRREMTYSRSPARWSQGPDQSPRPLTPQAPWRSSYVEFPREHISVSRNTPKSTGIKQRGPLVPSPSCDDQKVWHWGPGRQGCLGCSQRERYTHTHTHTHTCVVFAPIKSHPPINNLECIHRQAINLGEHGYTRVSHINLKTEVQCILIQKGTKQS